MANRIGTDALSSVDEALQLGATLRAQRKAQGITMTAAAEAAGISRITWYRLEKGEPGVSWGALLAAARAIGKQLRLSDPADAIQRADALASGALPLSIELSEFPELRRLAWQVGKRVETLTPREAAGMYARNARHLEVSALSERETNLMRALRQVVGDEVPDV